MRGIAVLLVVIYHSKLGLFQHGYIGVDVFFVLSGFLITSIILKDLRNNNFSFSTFYKRRAKRLLPALYSTLIFTSILSVFFLTSNQFYAYINQLLGALTFTANLVLPSQIGYFEAAADGKPLLHIWSLSLEEQYYFFLPLILFLCPQKYRLSLLITLFFASIYFCFNWINSNYQDVPFFWRIANASKAEWAFYLFPTRAWELLTGSLCAWLIINRQQISVPIAIKWLSLLVILFFSNMNINNQHPSIEALLVVLATSVILLGKDDWLPNNILVRFIEKAGDWSYSIYLIHWPLFAFSFLSFAGDVPTKVMLILVPISIFLGYCQFTYVETPMRQGKLSQKFSSWKPISLLTTLMIAWPVYFSHFHNKNSEDTFVEIRQTNFGLSSECDNSFNNNGSLKPLCGKPDKSTVAIWGDSYAMHLIPGILVNHPNVIQLTKSVCGPFIDLAPITSLYNKSWAEGCLTFNKRALNFILNNNKITHVVLSSSFKQYLSTDENDFLSDSGVLANDTAYLKQAFIDTFSALKAAGKTPILISPPPRAGFNVGECLERQFTGTLLLKEHCKIDYQVYQKHDKKILQFITEMATQIKTVQLEHKLCDQRWCKTEIDDTFIYRDFGHLSIEGSIKLLSDLNINQY